ncbi:MAG TPA: amino acid adenylation domain-containing protein, partial [Longimicrobiaceae bacterium]
MPNPHHLSTLVELLRLRADNDPDRVAYTFLLNGEAEEGHVTYGELDLRARAVAARFQALGARGERALLLYPPGLEYVAALFGCFYAGVVAVPAYPPRRNRPDPRLQSIVADCGPTLALTTRDFLGEAARLCANTPELAGLRWIATEDVPAAEAEGWRDPGAGGDTLAFLQYTSGSTAAPKGVMVSHGNLLHNFAVIEQLAGYTPETRSVIWLPPYHDMGLIGGILQPLFTGYWAALFSPVAFIQRPARWLEAVSRYGATSSGGPNFAYDLCVHTVGPEEREALDLSRWEIAFNGAEPVRAETLRAFAEAFAPCGFRARAFYPCYGLAEATLMVTGSRPSEVPTERAVDPEALGEGAVVADPDPQGKYRLVGSGRSAPSQRVIVVDPATLRECPPDRVGEVWVSGPSVARGYWGRPAETAETFAGFVAGTGEGPFLRTGDLGFLEDGELFITGRLKDLIVIRGRNHYPQDIEQTAARSHDGLRAGSGAAFSIDHDGEERLVVVQEVSRQAAAGVDVEEVAAAIRRAVAGEHGLQVHAVAVVRSGGVPKTTSGKVQRRACRAGFLAGELPLVGVSVREDAGSAAPRPVRPAITREALEAAAAEERQALLETLLVERAAEVLGVDPARIDREQPLVALGMDSLRAMELKGALEASLGAPVPISSLLDDTRIDRLAAELAAEVFLARPDVRARVEPEEGDAPLSSAQERLWFLDRLRPGSAAYNLAGALRLRGRVDARALRRSLEETVRRHEILRTVFPEAGGRPVQRVLPAGRLPLPEVDLSRLDPAAREPAARRVAAETARAPYDLAAGPLFRARLLRLGRDERLLVLGMHHIVGDGASAGVLVRELGALYPALLAGGGSPLPELPTQYGDWARRERERLRGDAVEAQLAWWRERLAGLQALDLPTDRARPAVQGFRGATHRFEVPAEVMEGVRALARAEGATLFAALLAAWSLLLARYAGEGDVAVGTPISRRGRAEVAALVGLFVDTLVLRVEVAPEAGFRSLLGRARTAALEAFAHQDVPFERLVEEVQPERDLSRNPLFQVMLAPQETTPERVELPGATLSPEPLDSGASIVDLTLYTWERGGGGLAAALEYAADLFDLDTARRMAAHLVQALRAVVANPDLPVAEVPLLLPAERAQLLEEWSAAGADHPADCLHELFAAQAARTPDAAAVRFAGRPLAYAELERAANRLAHHLRALGAGPETRVGLCTERTPRMLVGILGILKAGAAYVPLDPAYPAERLEYMLADAGAALVVSESHLAGRLPAGVPAVLLDADADFIAARPDTAPAAGAEPGNLAYVLYTSGSTGRPKGVQVEHRSASRIVHFLRDAVRPEDRAAVLGSTSISFDVSVGEIFGTLCWGGTLVLVDSALDLPSVADEGVRLVVTVPSAAAELLRGGGIPESVRAFNLAGEALPASLARGLWERPRTERVLNLYGPTEDTVYSTWSETERGAERVGIGRAVPGSRAYVLDAAGNPAPVSVAGELCLGGGGVARGYHGRPELTADRFVPDPFSPEPGARMYRTGDRARRVAGGELEYLGRIDQQVKVRGFRVEPGEVEAALRAHPAVGEAVVVARADGAGGGRLAAYHLAVGGASHAGAAELRAWLRERLPEHMVPSAFVALDELPLTPSGKLDRRVLPEPEAEAAGAARFAAPSTPVQEILAGIWADVLGAGRVGVNDDFFALGGHSLLAARVISRIREALGVEPPLRALFEAPTVAALAGRIEELGAAGSAAAPPVRRTPREGPPPLSFAQQRLWVEARLDPASPAYNMPAALRVRGPLSAGALRSALDALVRRHETLRTTFAERDGVPVQVIHPAAPVALPTVDLGAIPAGARGREAERLAHSDALRPFDLTRGPLLRVTLLRLAEDDHVVCFALHHIAGDGWSIEVLVRELSALYDAGDRGEPAPLPDLPVQYADYAAWQREHFTGDRLRPQLDFWRERLGGAPPLLEIPTDRPRGAGRDARAGRVPIALPAGLQEELRALSRREGTTLFMTLLAGWQALLARWSGQDDVVVGAPVAGRSHREVEGLIGCFVNMLALRADLGGAPTWRELLARVRDTTLGGYAHQEVPFERLVDEVAAGRSLAYSPLFQATLSMARSAAHQGLALGSLGIEPFGDGGGIARYDLELAFQDGGDALAGTLDFRAALFEPATAERLAGHLSVLLEAMAAEPARRVREVPLLRGGERRQVLETWNATAAAYPRGCVHELVSAQAARTPDAAALVFAGRTLGYAALERRANRLANHLRRLGVGPETRVGVCLERTPELVVALLAVLKAGGAYVPLDPAYPRERLGWMREDAGISLVVTSGALVDVLPAGARALVLDAAAAAVEAEPDRAPESGVLPENLSHVIFTSGSTGRPKGVMIRHSSTVVLLHWLRGAVSDEERASVLFSTSVSFDVSVAEVFGTLAWGGTLVMVENALELAGLAEPVVHASMVPTAAAELLRMGGIPASVRTLNLGGEPLPADLAQALYALGTVERVGNLYGPTEDTTYSTYSLVPRGGERVTVGRPVANTQARVLDAELEPAPVGVAGELYLAGDGLARGYAGRPDLTAERFLPDPFGAPGARMYRVMDRVRWLASGELEYLGRTDFQVKVRGFRIEPGEIEAALRSHPAVRDAVALVREDAPGDRRIVAYVVPAEGAAADAAALRAHLRERVPEYMLPSAFVALGEFPLTPGGKLDRRALPAPEAADAGADAPARPRTPTEELLVGIFAEVLGVERVGARDDFFELGGHSLLATRAAARARAAFGVDVPLRAIFEAPTAAELAEMVDGLLREGGGVAAPPVVPVPRDGSPLPLSFAQQRLWFIDRLQPGSDAYNIPAAMRIRGPLDVGALRRAFTELVRRHEALRTVLVESGGEAAQVILPAAPVPLPVLDFSGLPWERREVEALGRVGEEGRRPFDLSRGPLLRLVLARLEEEWLLCFTMHHVASDGWSIVVLVRELSALYAAYSRGEASPLPELPVQYADYAVWQREWLRGETLDTLLGYWRERLEGAPPLLELPTDHPRRGGPGAAEGSRPFTLSAAAARALRALGRRESATLFMTLLAGWQTLLGRYAGQEDVVVGTPVAGRSRAEVEGLIGFFVNTLVMRADLGGDPTFRELLARVRETALGAFAHQDLPFERLVEELAPERSLAHNPLFQVMFVLQNLGAVATGLGELATESPGGGAAAAHFDLGVTFFEDGERLRGRIDYRVDLFDGPTIERMADHYLHLLESAAADPDRRAAELRLMSAAEERRILVEWNSPGAYPEEKLVPRLIAEQAERTPDAPAVTGGGTVLTYAELEARSGRLAQALRELGVGPEIPVGVLLERGPWLLEAVLGIWKAGGAFLPLDPTYPPERLDYMLRDARVPVLVSQERLRDALPAHGARVLLLDADGERIASATPAAPPAEHDGSQLAYVIYTSGSTGRPKGVRVPHRALLHTLLATNEAFGAAAGEVTPVLASFSFDVWLAEAVFPLANGGGVRMVPRGSVLDTGRLVDELAGCASLHTVPSLMREIVRTLRGRGSHLPELRLAFVGGEAVPPELLDEMREAFPAADVHVMYGPTEGAIDCTSHRAREGGARRHWLGRPLRNASLYVLDRAGQPVPAGVPGELCVGGACLARDYLGRPELTAEKFVPDPFSGGPGARLYHTGDRVRWTAEGELEFLGRIDHQVKIRGLRIEPGEVEAVLAGYPGVSEAVVAVREEAPGRAMLVAYLVPAAAEGGAALVDELRAHLRGLVPEQMVPAAFVILDSLPLSPNGKVDRRALPAPVRGGGGREGGAPLTGTERALAAIWEEVLGVGGVGVGDNFFDLGGHSLLLVQVHSRLEERFPDRVALVDLFTHRTLGALAAHLDRAGAPKTPPAPEAREAPAAPAPRDAPAARPEPARADAPATGAPRHPESRPPRDGGATRHAPTRQGPMRAPGGNEVAIIGMAGRFPGARDVDELWRNLRSGVRSLRRFTEEELAAAGVSPRELRSPGYVPVTGALEGAELFDAAFFGFTPREALVMNPQQRVFLECAWEALERAGYASRGSGERMGVYASQGENRYMLDVLSERTLARAVGTLQVLLSNGASVATLTSYKLGLQGPSLNVQTACSSSLVAVHLACRALLGGEADVALAGGVRIDVPQLRGYHYQPGGILSPTGECTPFDAAARGSVAGSGAGVVVLKRLEDALADGDHVHAVIRGSAINNDGDEKVGYTAPRWEGQAAVIRNALAAAGVDPAEVSYVEAHGSGTEVGDPIEVAALAAAMGPGRPGSCALGAVKSSIGHLDAAAGVAGLIKAALALEHGEIPPSPYFREPNPRIDFGRSPFFVNAEPRPWARGGTPRRAGVSSFGMGGTNAHVVLEEAPQVRPSGPSRPWQLLVLSARTPAALDAASARLAEHLRAHPEQKLADVAHTLRVGRRRFAHRRALVVRSREDAAGALEALDARRLLEGAQERDARPVAFLFPGVGDHYAQMARGLYEAEPVFRRELDRCADLLLEHAGVDVLEALFPGDPAPEQTPGGAAEDPGEEESVDLRGMLGRGAVRGDDPLGRTDAAHPAVFVVEYALARLWMSWGVRPAAMIGHSLGEYVAATVAGVFTLEDALELLAHRARLISALPAGAMLAVPLDPAELRPRLRGGLALAAHNAPGLCTVSGSADAVDALEAELRAEGVACRRLVAEHAFHSAEMEPVAGGLAERLREMTLAAPEVPFVSNVTGTWIRAEEATDPEYWARHLCGTVRFAEGMEELLRDGSRVLLEVGPGRTLGTFALHAGAAEGATFASLRHAYTRKADQVHLLETLGRLWVAGVQVDWDGFAAGERRRRTLLPTYPFERQAYWVERRRRRRAGRRRSAVPASTGPVPEGAAGAAPADAGAGTSRGLQPRPETGTRYVAPEGELQVRMAELWQEMLGFDSVGAHDDFFSLGGHSLLATQLIARVQDEFGAAVSLNAVFDDPTVAGMADKVAALRADGRAELPAAIPRAPGAGPFPLSFHQERIWVLDRMEPGSPMYNVPVGSWLRGPVDPDAARRALAEIVRRHQVFRTVYAETGAGPVQVVLPDAEVPLPLEDLSDVPEAERLAVVRRRLTEEARRPLDLAAGPVVRARLLRLDAELHALLMTFHHIVMDGWSGGVFFHEWSTLYEAFVAGKPSPLPELPIQYADYAVWQREQLSGERLEAHLAFWRESMRGVPAVLELPTDRPHPPVQSYRGGMQAAALEPGLVARLRALAQRERTTFHVVLAAAFQALCFRYTGQEDFAVGSVAANRQRPEVQGIIGFFINTIPVRARPSARLRFVELVEQARSFMAEAYAHAEVPFQMILDAVRPERDSSRNPLMQVMLGIQAPGDHGPPPEDDSGLTSHMLEDSPTPLGDSGTSKFDLTILVDEGAAPSAMVEYNSDIFDHSTAVRFLDHYFVLLEGVADAPESPLEEIPLLLPDERRQLLEERAGAPVPPPAAPALPAALAELTGREAVGTAELEAMAEWVAEALRRARQAEEAVEAWVPVHERVLARAAETPHAVAAVSAEERLTYGELARRSAELAARLRGLGAGPEMRVALLAGRSPELLVAMLAVLRAGAAYLPIDPDTPAARVRTILADAAAPVVLADAALAARLDGFGGEVVALDTPHPPAPTPTRGEGEHDDADPREALPRNGGGWRATSEPGG